MTRTPTPADAGEDVDREPEVGRRSSRRLAFWLGIGVLGTVAAGVAWIAITGALARAQLQHVRAQLPQLRQAILRGDGPRARVLAARIAEESARAHALTTGPAWWVAANLPGVGEPLQTSRTIATAVDRIGNRALPAVVSLAEDMSHLDPARSGVDLRPIRAAAPALHRAAVVVDDALASVRSAAPSWFGPVRSARSSLTDQLVRVDGELRGADRAVGIALPMLGADRPQRYFVGFLNEAESRGVGGIPGAYAIATVNDGRLHFDHFGSDSEFAHVSAPVDLGPEYDSLYGQDAPTRTFPNSDIGPDFRDAARIWAGLWQKKTGTRIDGAVALDPTALSYLLAVTGPARTADGTTISAENVVASTQRDLYRQFDSGTPSGTAQRKGYVVALSRAIAHRLAQGGKAQRLVRATARAAAERRFVVWSASPVTEEKLVAAGWAGAVEGRAGTPTTGVVVVNAAGGKLDYYLQRSLTYVRHGCGTGSTAIATIDLTNAAPSGLPAYVTERVDGAPRGAKPGDSRLLVTYFASPGARIESVALDGRPLPVTSATENGLTIVTVDVELPRTATRTIRLRIAEPPARAPVDVVRQPLVHALRLHLDGDRCGGG